MVLENSGWVGSQWITAGSLNGIDTTHEKELDRASGFNAGSTVYYRDANNFIISGITYDITNGSDYTEVYHRDANNFIISGQVVELGKTIDLTYYRDANDFITSGLTVVS